MPPLLIPEWLPPPPPPPIFLLLEQQARKLHSPEQLLMQLLLGLHRSSLLMPLHVLLPKLLRLKLPQLWLMMMLMLPLLMRPHLRLQLPKLLPHPLLLHQLRHQFLLQQQRQMICLNHC
jgi:hypothetical protein